MKIITIIFLLLLFSCNKSVEKSWDGEEEISIYDIYKRPSNNKVKTNEQLIDKKSVDNKKISYKNLDQLLHKSNNEEMNKIETEIKSEKLIKFSYKLPKNRILAVLPLSGKYQKVGNNIKNIILKVNNELEVPFNIDFFDTNSDIFYKIGDLYDLFVENPPTYIIGPLRAEETYQLIAPASIKNIPIFSFAPDSNLTKYYKKLYIQSITPINSIYTVTKYAIEEMNIKKFAILYTYNEMGLQYLEDFTQFVTDSGGEVTKAVAIDPYENKITQLDKPISKLVSRDMDSLKEREDYKRILRRSKNVKKGYWRKRFINREKRKLKPVFDFDAIFLPISQDRAKYVIPILAAWDIPLLTRNKRLMEQVYHKYLNKRQRYVQVLGIPFWHTKTIFEGGSKYLNGVLFPAAYSVDFENNVDPFVLLFKKKDKKSYIYEALTYDLLNILYYVFEKKEMKIEDYTGAMGTYSLYRNQFFKDMNMIMIDNNQFIRY